MHTSPKGPVGSMAKKEASSPPDGKLDLQHSFDGTKNKEVVKIG
jgi:hypothetical protein